MIEIHYKHFFSELLLHAIKAIHTSHEKFDMLDVIYKFINDMEKETLIEFKKNQSMVSYENDLILYLEMIRYVRNLYEQREEYEVCAELIKKENECVMLLNNKN